MRRAQIEDLRPRPQRAAALAFRALDQLDGVAATAQVRTKGGNWSCWFGVNGTVLVAVAWHARSADAQPGVDDDLWARRAVFDPHVTAQRKA